MTHREPDLPAELATIRGRQRQLLNVIYGRGSASVEEIRQAIPDPPTDCAVRTLLGRLVLRGAIKKRSIGRKGSRSYAPAISNWDARKRAFERIADDCFGGSKRDAVAALAALAQEE
ncbi:BlaI/MecI/CopY family transcriptional regulator [Sphingomonas sp. ASV193]|uniref:BlaI/MecI/CopY family transcriptional regulator n=1 Tax=Sphingomonas sp. ASV193 TaxID=3144405 RepID=UPI0032E8BE5C